MSLAIARPTDLYAAALHSMTEPDGHRHWYARYEGGPRRSLGEALRRWCGTADATDQELLARAPGAVLDVGCGPGRLVIELARQGREGAGVGHLAGRRPAGQERGRHRAVSLDLRRRPG